MQKHYSGTGEKKQEEHAEHISESIARSLDGAIAMSNELEEKLAQIKNCPELCEDGMVEIKTSSGQKTRLACPLAASNCSYGERMGQRLDRYVIEVMSHIGIPRRHLENYAEIIQIDTLVEIDKWLMRGFLIITGGTGSGKSFGAALAVRNFLTNRVTNHLDYKKWEMADHAGNSVIWCAAMDINDDRETSALAKSKYFAVIDDLGGETDNSDTRTAMSGVLLRRYDMTLPTVITTTMTMLDIDLRYGGRIADRLIEDIGNGGMIIECGDVSIRNHLGKNKGERT